MNSRETELADQVSKSIKEFNEEVKATHIYYQRKRVQTTPTIFFDNDDETFPQFRGSHYGWCTIAPELAELLQASQSAVHMISFEGEEERKLLDDAEFLSQCQKDTPMLLRTLASLYLRIRYQLAEAYEPTIGARIKGRITELSKLVHEGSS